MTDAANEPAIPALLEKFVITIVIPLEYEVQAGTTMLAAVEARKILSAVQTKHPAAKLLRIMNDVTYVALEPLVPAGKPAPPTSPPRGSPSPGGTPGTPVIKEFQDVTLIAKAA